VPGDPKVGRGSKWFSGGAVASLLLQHQMHWWQWPNWLSHCFSQNLSVDVKFRGWWSLWVSESSSFLPDVLLLGIPVCLCPNTQTSAHPVICSLPGPFTPSPQVTILCLSAFFLANAQSEWGTQAWTLTLAMSGSEISISMRKEKRFPNKHRAKGRRPWQSQLGRRLVWAECQNPAAWSCPTPSLLPGSSSSQLWPSAQRCSFLPGWRKVAQGSSHWQLSPLLNVMIPISVMKYTQSPAAG
jgi:hypothetical protein